MFKKTLAAAIVAGALLFAGASAANADTATDAPYPPDNSSVTVSPNSVAVGQTATITANVPDDYISVTFESTAGSTLSSIVAAAATGSSVTKTPTNGVATASFSATTPGTYTVTVSGGTGNAGGEVGSVTITVTAAAAAGGAGGGLPSTGGEIPAAALWIGAGALGLGALAVVAATARRRAQR